PRVADLAAEPLPVRAAAVPGLRVTVAPQARKRPMAHLSRTVTIAAVTIFLLGASGNAPGQGRGVLSPEVTADRRITFRLQAPHGTLHEHWYVNKDNGTARRVVVYTPPGYGAGTRSYPVVYLLHGADDFERGWTQTGRANWIMDNLLADGKARPALIVMPFGHEVSGSTGKLSEVRALQASLGVDPAARGGRGPGGTSFMERDLLGNVIPLVEK